ncbi:UNVERIFIED_CONTAM: hypothetical protein PYX00_007212 [Menopon gallinae]|uniref:Uncharacterized protein n=1 Tax=Menopon gallinae TaxID=328185 RepID=A0AAW2HIC6_9NEOP
MKYPQLVHMPGDVEHWLEKQLEARGIDSITCEKYILNLLAHVNTAPSMEYFPHKSHSYYGNTRCYQAYGNRQSWDVDSWRLGVVHYPMSTLKEKIDIEKLVDELCVKLKEVENDGTAFFDVSTNFGNEISQTNAPVIHSDAMLSGNLFNMNETQPFPSCNSIWTRGLLHDSEPVKDQSKMEDYFSSLFYENPSDNFGFEFTRLKSDERQDGKERDRINFYNKQNLLASECTERLYERNTDIDKLIAKFDANIEGIWNPPYESNELGSLKYDNMLPENLTSNPYLQSGSNLIWSFGQNGNDFANEKHPKENPENQKSNFSVWSKFSSPVITSSNVGFNAMVNSVNLTLSNVQKWSSIDGQNDALLNHKRHASCFAEVVPKSGHLGGNNNMHGIIPHERNRGNGEEEDLLTSAKTHFRPIRMEEMQANQTVAYADGTTFAISNELEKVTFTRSNSGILYLDTDSEYETPRKYMEFKEREISTKLFDSESDLSLMEEFVPKFRVRQSNEKCCQTEDVIEDDQIVPSLIETDCESDSCECDADEFFFPGDSELAENIAGSETRAEFRRIKSDCNYNDIYVSENVLSSGNRCVCSIGNAWLPSGDCDARQEWGDIWGGQDTYENTDGFPTRDEYFRFREELTEEGEQLLSDLSCLQQIYSSSKWGDDESGTVSDFNDEESADVFCSTEFLNKFKSNCDADWKNLWYRGGDMTKSNSDENVVRMEEKLKVTEKNLSSKLNEIRERPFITEKSKKERKRRNSTSQKLYGDGQCNRTHYRFSFCDQANPHLFPADVSRMKGESYELSKILKRPLSF